MSPVYHGHRDRRRRLASPYYRGVQDAGVGDPEANPYRPGTMEHTRYAAGYCDVSQGREIQPLEGEELANGADRPPPTRKPKPKWQRKPL